VANPASPGLYRAPGFCAAWVPDGSIAMEMACKRSAMAISREPNLKGNRVTVGLFGTSLPYETDEGLTFHTDPLGQASKRTRRGTLAGLC
jgi:hypothetical protein